MIKKVDKAIFMNQDERKLEQLVQKSNRVILKISTIFPFDFFTDDIIISENQIDVVMREFFWAEHIESILIKDIQQVSVETSVLFAQLTISIFKPESSPLVMNYLSRADAILARRIIYGLIAAEKEKIDVGNMGMSELLHKLEMIGSTQG